MSWRSAFGLALMGLAISSSAQADATPTGEDLVQLRRIVRDFSVCTVKKRKTEAKKAVLENIDNYELLKKYPNLLTADCMRMDGELRMPGDQIVYGLADALVQQEFRSDYPGDIASRAKLSHQKSFFDEEVYRKSAKFRKEGEHGVLKNKRLAEDFYFLSEFGECVVRKNPDLVYHFLLTPVATPAEESAFEGIAPLLGPCVTAGTKVAINIMTVRGTLAKNFYRLAYAPAAASSQEAAK